jgi:CheW-like domain
MYELSHKNQTATEKKEFLAFTLGSEEYCIDILKVQEIRGYEIVTPIPNTPAFMKGVVNLRGIIVPIIDLRIKLALDNVEYNQFTVVIILSIRGRVVGVVVDHGRALADHYRHREARHHGGDRPSRAGFRACLTRCQMPADTGSVGGALGNLDAAQFNAVIETICH